MTVKALVLMIAALARHGFVLCVGACTVPDYHGQLGGYETRSRYRGELQGLGERGFLRYSRCSDASPSSHGGRPQWGRRGLLPDQRLCGPQRWILASSPHQSLEWKVH